MNFAVFGRQFNIEHTPYIQELISYLESYEINIIIYEPFFKSIEQNIIFSAPVLQFSKHDELIKYKADYLISIGGDGTLLDTITIVRDSKIPVLGINTGRLGFLSSISKDEIIKSIKNIVNKNYYIEERSLLRLETSSNLFGDLNFAMNEVTVLKTDQSSMITIKSYIDDIYLNTYWADGLIIATPTGSTGYSLSCGGPILTPDTDNIIITPIASHNLTVRPLVIPDNKVVKLKVIDRNNRFLVCLDSRSIATNSDEEITILKEKFKINLLKINQDNFFTSIQNKLMWGLDKRN